MPATAGCSDFTRRESREIFRDAVFNYPTLAEAYKVAGLDGTNRL